MISLWIGTPPEQIAMLLVGRAVLVNTLCWAIWFYIEEFLGHFLLAVCSRVLWWLGSYRFKDFFWECGRVGFAVKPSDSLDVGVSADGSEAWILATQFLQMAFTGLFENLTCVIIHKWFGFSWTVLQLNTFLAQFFFYLASRGAGRWKHAVRTANSP